MGKNIAVRVDHVTKTFKLPHEKQGSIKSALINFRRSNRGYEKQRVLDDVSFEIQEGEFVGIIGRNGSGKSTLLKLLAGIYAPDSGTVQINGKLTPFIELGVGFNQELSGRENVFLNGALLGFNRDEMAAMYQDIVDFAEIERFMDQKLKNYSSGMQVRLAFSIAIRAQADILLLDEVLAVGDAAFQQKCFNYFEELKVKKTTVVFVSHDMGAIRRFCTRAIYVDKGKVTHQGTPAEISEVYNMDNLESGQKDAKDTELTASSKYSLSCKITHGEGGTEKITINYAARDDTKMYVGISLMKDGISIGEIITNPSNLLTGNGTLTYVMDTKNLNPGAYQVDAALFAAANRGLLAFTKIKGKFIVKGEDPTRGAAIHLPDTWKYS